MMWAGALFPHGRDGGLGDIDYAEQVRLDLGKYPQPAFLKKDLVRR